MKLIGICILIIFYTVYFGKMFLQRRKGIQTNQIAKGKRNKTFYIELIMKFATYIIVVAEIFSIFLVKQSLPKELIICGIVLGLIGDIIFALAIISMKDSWRAGLAENDKTEMITGGIYKISRNPAFLGFDCVYISILLMFFNIPLLIFTCFAIIMLHLQILQEEKYLPNVFGDEYIHYKKKVCRYLGRKR